MCFTYEKGMDLGGLGMKCYELNVYVSLRLMYGGPLTSNMMINENGTFGR